MHLIAINTIHRAKGPGKNGKAAETEVISKGQPFTESDEEGNRLIASGAASKDKSKKPASNTETDPETAAAKQEKTEVKPAVEPSGEKKEPGDMTAAEIKAELAELDAKAPSSANKDDLVKLLTEARSDDVI